MGDARTRHIEAKASQGAKSRTVRVYALSPATGYSLTLVGVIGQERCARCAPGVARPSRWTSFCRSPRSRSASRSARISLAVYVARRLQPHDALALAGRPRHRGRRLRRCARASCRASPALDARSTPPERPRSARPLYLIALYRWPVQVSSDEVAIMDAGEATTRTRTRRSVRRQLLPHAAGAPLHRLGQAREPARRRRPLPHAAPARARRPADRRRLLRALPAAHCRGAGRSSAPCSSASATRCS